MVKYNGNTPFRLYRRGKIWHAYISVFANGQRVVFRETTGTTERSTAFAWATQRIGQIINSPDNTHEITLDQAAGRWFEEYGQYLASAQDLLSKLSNLLKLIPGDILLSKISKNIVNNMVERIHANGRTPATVNRYLCLLSAICRRAHDNWECKTPDFKILSFRLREPRENIKYFANMNEINRLLEYAPKHLQPIILCALYTGLRRGRILSLKWEQIDLDKKQIFYIGKDGKPHSVPIVAPLKDLLNTLPRCSDYVFTYNGHPIGDIKHSWQRTFERAGVPYRNFHTLRHTTATWLLQKTGNLKIVQNILGHCNISTTTKYAHLMKDEAKQALDSVFD